jgi:TonB family protein
VTGTILLILAAAVQGYPAAPPAPPGPPPPSLKIAKQPDARRYYPERARKAGVTGRTKLEVDLRMDGKVMGCRLSETSGSADLDKASCRLARAVRFEETRWYGPNPPARVTHQFYGCCTRLVVDWAGGTAQVRKSVAPRKAQILNNTSIVTDADYPAEAIRLRAEGLAVVELTTTVRGEATACRVVTSTGTSVLDEATCRLAMTRAKLSPATDEYGESVAGTATLRFVWRLGT